MWNILCVLPPEVAGGHVFSFLDWLDVVHIDSAVVSNHQRPRLHLLLRSMDHIKIPNNSHSVAQKVDIWAWFWKRNVRLSGINVHNDLSVQWRAIMDNMHLIAGGVGITFRLNAQSDEVYELFSENDALCLLVSEFHVPSSILNDRLAVFLTKKLRNLKRMTLASATAPWTESQLAELILANPTVECLKLANPLSIGDLKTVLTTLRNVKDLELQSLSTTNSDFLTLVQAYPQLVSITVYRHRGKQYISDEGLTVLAQSCPQLRSVTVQGGYPAPSAMLELALHCHHLRELNFAIHTSMSDAVLAALQANCPDLTTLRCAWTAMVTEGGVHASAVLLGQLRSLEIDNHDGFNTASFAAALQYTTKLQTLRVEVYRAQFTGAELDAISCSGGGGLRHVTFGCNLQMSVSLSAVDAAFVRLAQRNPCLTYLNVGTGVMVRSEVVTALAANCPKLQELLLTTLRPGIVDDAIVALAQNCPQLRVLSGAFGSGTTDVAVLALAQHCPRLQSRLEFHNSPLITATAVELIIRQCRCIIGAVFLPQTVATQERKALQRIADEVQRPPGYCGIQIW